MIPYVLTVTMHRASPIVPCSLESLTSALTTSIGYRAYRAQAAGALTMLSIAHSGST